MSHRALRARNRNRGPGATRDQFWRVRAGDRVLASPARSCTGGLCMKDANGYLEEIRENMKKIQAQGKVTPTENALFGMIDGLAGLQMATLERLAELNR